MIDLQIACLGIALQSALPFEVTLKPVRYFLHQLRKHPDEGRATSMETGACTVGALSSKRSMPYQCSALAGEKRGLATDQGYR
jgi:hypothetical protein